MSRSGRPAGVRYPPLIQWAGWNVRSSRGTPRGGGPDRLPQRSHSGGTPLRLAALAGPRLRGRRRRVPNPKSVVLAGGGEPQPVGAESHAADRRVVPAQGEGLLAGAEIPESHGLVPTAGGQAQPVGAEGDALDIIAVPA